MVRTLHSLVALTLATFALAFAACGGGNKPPTQPGNADSSGAAGGTAPTDADAGPATTTTVTLGNNGDLQGAKLSSSSTQTYGADAGARPTGSAGPHQPDPGRSPKDIQAIVLAHRDEARACYDAGVKQHPGIEGDLVIQWTIDPKGNVSAISADEMRSQISEPGVIGCITDSIKRIRFSESPRGFETKTFYPFNFHPRMKP